MKSSNQRPIRFSITLSSEEAGLLRRVMEVDGEPPYVWSYQGLAPQRQRQQVLWLIHRLLYAGFAGLVRRGSVPSTVAADIRPETRDETAKRCGRTQNNNDGPAPRFNISFGE